MKDIRTITEVVLTDYSDENNNSDQKLALLQELDSEPGYYQQVIRPMLAPGHENELVYWLKSFGLIPNVQHCKNLNMDMDCQKAMNWVPAKVQDLYQWKCGACSLKKSIRDDSLFCSVKCNFKNVIKILLAWCKRKNIESIADTLGVKKAVVGGLYNVAGTVATKFVKSHIQEWQLGGPNQIVLIDTYPDICAYSNPNIRGITPILCFAEAKTLPQKFWFEALDRYHRTNQEQVETLRKNILKSIEEIILPGSILVIPSNSSLCSFDDIHQALKHLYPVIVNTDSLSKHNTQDQNLLDILDMIWGAAMNVCEEAQLYGHSNVQQFLTSTMWERRFGGDAFEMLLYQMSMLQ